jgi:hypothetical protein
MITIVSVSLCLTADASGVAALFHSTPDRHASLTEPNVTTQARVSGVYGKLPLSFEANLGQAGEPVKFISRGTGYTLFLTSTEAVLELRNADFGMRNEKPIGDPTGASNPQSAIRHPPSTVLRLKLVGANPAPRVVGREELPGKSNYFIGNDPTKWRANVPHYANVKYEAVYPGVDLIYYGNQRQLEYDFVVAPGADPNAIALAFQGTEKIEVDTQGDLVLHAAGGQVRQQKPLVYQEADGARQGISGGYVLRGREQVGFRVGVYDVSRPLVIDPVLAYSTYLGGNGNDIGNSIAVDNEGHVYVTGPTLSTNFPTTPGTFQTRYGGSGAAARITGIGGDVFVAKLNPTGSALIYCTYLGGSDDDGGSGLAVDAEGNAYVTGGTQSPDFPTANALDPTYDGGTCQLAPLISVPCSDLFIAKLDPTGSALIYSTYLGSGGNDGGKSIAVDAEGNAYVTGGTNSTNFPATPGAVDTDFNGGRGDAVVMKMNSTGSALVYSTFLGGDAYDNGNGIAVDAEGNAYVTGVAVSTDFPTTPAAFDRTFNGGDGDAFAAKLNATGSALVYSTYLGGERDDAGFGLAVDAAGNAYVTGNTLSSNFPRAHPLRPGFGGGSDAFVAKLDVAGSALIYSTYLGGSGDEQGNGIAVDAAGSAYVMGGTSSTSFPIENALQPARNGRSDAFVTKLNAEGAALIYSTYLGGGRDENMLSIVSLRAFFGGIAVDSAGNAYVVGFSTSTDLPTTPGAVQKAHGGSGDAFIVKIQP